MNGVKIYTIDRDKMIKVNEEGYNPHQEQAKIYHNRIEKDDKHYNVSITNEKLIKELFSFIQIPDELQELNKNDYGILLSIRHMENEKYLVTCYFNPVNKCVTHYTISCYSEKVSDYELANKIVKYINKEVNHE